MEALFYWVGIIVVASFVIYLLLFLLHVFIKEKIDPFINNAKMPILRPLPIPTKNQSYIGRVLTWIFHIREWELMEDWYFQIKEDDDDPVTIVIRAGFDFDGASIPRPLWAVLSPVGLLLIPGLIHDYGYRYNHLIRVDEEGESHYPQDADRRYWDALFKNVGESINGFTLINYVAWLGVRLGGFITWRRYRANE